MQRGRGGRAARVGVALLLMVGATLALATAAGAHASLESTTPAEDEVLEAAPPEIALRFNEPVSAGDDAIRLFDPAGELVPGITGTSRDETLSATVPSLTTDGSYTVSWRVVSADGHPLAGAFLFHLREKTLTAPAAGTEGSGTPFGAGLLRAAGSVLLFSALTWIAAPWWFGRPRRRGRSSLIAWMVALVGVGALAGGGAWAAGDWSTFASTNTATAVLVLAVILLAGLVSRARSAAELLATVGLVALALPGHAISLDPIPLSVSLTVLHVLAAAVWIGGLLDMERASRGNDPTLLRRTVEQRSPVLMGSVVVLAIAGGWLAIDRVGWTTLLDTTYGQLAAIKVGLLGGAVTLAAYHRFALTPQMSTTSTSSSSPPSSPAPAALSSDVARPESARIEPAEPAPDIVRAFRLGIRIEIVIVAAAVVLGGALGQFPPGDEAAGGTGSSAAADGPFVERVAFGEGLRVELYISPAARGRNDVHLTVFDDNGDSATDIQDLAVTLSLPDRDISGITPAMTEVTSSHSIAQNVQLPFDGEWLAQVTGRRGDFEALRADLEVPIAP